jgi:hypothetical protein
MRTPSAARRRNAKDIRPFPVCPRLHAPQIREVRRLASIALLLLATAASVPAASDPFAKYGVVAIKPGSSSLFIATVSMTFQPFVRHNTVFSSTYSARVYPYFFFSEKGRIWIVIPDDLLVHVDRGEPVDFVGHAMSDGGDSRRVDGHATPTGPSTGKIRVRVFISRRISLSFDTTYELKGPASPQVAVIAR